MKTTKKTENPLLKRAKVEIEVEHHNKPTPKKADISKAVADLMKVAENLVVIEHIYTSFSSGVSKVIAYVYKDEAALKNMQIKKKKKKKAEPKPAA